MSSARQAPSPSSDEEPQPADARLLVLPQSGLQAAGRRRAGGFPGRAAWPGCRRATGPHGRTTTRAPRLRTASRRPGPRGRPPAAASLRRTTRLPSACCCTRFQWSRASCSFWRSTSTHWPRRRTRPSSAAISCRHSASVELLVAQGQCDLEIEHRAEIELALLRVADRDADARPRAFLPPVGQPDQDAALLERGHVLQEPVSGTRRPCQRLVEIARIEQFLHQRASLGGRLDRREQMDERLLVLGPGQLAERVAERLVLDAAAGCQPRGIGRQESERVVLVPPILGQVEAHAPHLVPQRRPLLQKAR